jgi:hypothetical protein
MASTRPVTKVMATRSGGNGPCSVSEPGASAWRTSSRNLMRLTQATSVAARLRWRIVAICGDLRDHGPHALVDVKRRGAPACSLPRGSAAV